MFRTDGVEGEEARLTPLSSTRAAVEVERMGALTLAFFHFAFAGLVLGLLWESPSVGRTPLEVWAGGEMVIGLVSLGAFLSARSPSRRLFGGLSFAECLGSVVSFCALPWLGSHLASTAPTSYLLAVALVVASSIAATHSSQTTRRRRVFAWMMSAVALSYSLAFVVGGQFVFAFVSVVWCLTIVTLTRVGYHRMMELLELRRASERTARHDDLTGLLSRRAFFETLQRAAATDRSPATQGSETVWVLVLFDLDGFKAINDSFGHGSGDAVLQAVAKRLRLYLPADAAIGRLGGDEFGAVFSAQRLDMLAAVEGTLGAIAEPIRSDGRELYIAASAGWTEIEIGDRTYDLMAQADAALYQSKYSETMSTSGFDAKLRAELDRSSEMRQRFRTALNRREITFWGQPLARLSDRAPVAIELLARWPQGRGESIEPAEFTRIADETGLAVDLDRQALAAAASLLSSWVDDPILGSIIVKVNVSPVHLHKGQLMSSVLELVPRPLRPRLGIEFVESRLIPAAERNREQLRDLREMGITVSIDDFGVGYSSLAYLRTLPVSEIKIDRSFVAEVDTDRINRGLVRAIVDLASTLGLPTVAEGIESAAEYEAVAELGVSLGQGYFLGHPCPVGDVANHLRRLHFMAVGEPKPPISIRR